MSMGVPNLLRQALCTIVKSGSHDQTLTLALKLGTENFAGPPVKASVPIWYTNWVSKISGLYGE